MYGAPNSAWHGEQAHHLSCDGRRAGQDRPVGCCAGMQHAWSRKLSRQPSRLRAVRCCSGDLMPLADLTAHLQRRYVMCRRAGRLAGRGA